MFYSELNVFTCLNACGVYTELYVLCKKCVQIVTQCIKSLGSEKGTLQIGIRAKVSTLSLDGPVERSLDRECEGKLGLEGQFRTLVCSKVSRSC
jgi:hypothetical protein